MPFILHPRWYSSPILSLRSDEGHFTNISKYSKASLLIFPLTPKSVSPASLPLPRVNLTGNLLPITQQNDLQLILDKYDKEFPGSLQYLQEPNIFHFYQFSVTEVNYLNTSGRLENINSDEFRLSPDDPIAPVSRKIIEKVNDRMAKEILGLCKNYGQVDVKEAFVFALDRLGFDILGKDTETDSWYYFRVPLETPITNIDDYELTITQSLKGSTRN